MVFSRKRKFLKKRVVRKGLRRRVYRKTKRTFASRVRAIVSRAAESKIRDSVLAKTELYHNGVSRTVINGNTNLPTQGTLGTERVGDEIFVKGFMCRFMFGQKADRPNVSFRIIVANVNKAYLYSYSAWFRSITGNVLLDPVNADVVKVIKQYTIRPNQAALSATGDKEYTFAHKLWIPVGRKYRFPTVGNDADCDNLYVFVIAYDAFGSLTTDNIAYWQMGVSCHYKDL